MTDLLTPIDVFLAEQRGTPVERFARHHDLVVDEGSTARHWEERIPAAGPESGQQYAFRIDLDSCSGCKSCVAACHGLNGLDAGESWRTVGTLLDAGGGGVQTVPSGCQHCIDPACLAGCPTKAYEKDPITGIVIHLDDQCFGCGYCTLTCPYEVPTMNARLGVVRKCDMCTDRLAEGEAPACVQACPTGAITIDIVDRDEIELATSVGSLVPGAPLSSATHPTTKYVSSRPLGTRAVAADAHAVHPSAAHPPLEVFLVAGQVSVGTWSMGALASSTTMLIAATVCAVFASMASVFHLGRPLVAWRAVLGVGHSWLSREIVAFGCFVMLAAISTTAAVLETGPVAIATTITAIVGSAAVWCSALLYAVTKRPWWSIARTVARFAGTTVGGGGALSAATSAWTGDAVTPFALAAVSAITVSAVVQTFDLRRSGHPDLMRTRVLLAGPLQSRSRWRSGLATAGSFALLASLTDPDAALVLAPLGAVLVVAGALVERRLFFVASVAPRMPGGLP